jgi:cytochrome P450
MKIDFRSPAFIDNPYPVYAELRKQAAVTPLSKLAWLVTGYKEADQVLRDPRLGALASNDSPDATAEPAYRIRTNFLPFNNPPMHTRLRGLLSKSFSVRQANELRVLVQSVEDDLIDGWIGRGQADLVEVFNYPLTIRVICAMLDIEQAHSAALQTATSALVKTLEFSQLDPQELAAANAAALRFEAFFRDMCRERRHHRGNDLISLLLQAEEGSERMSEEEIIANIVFLFMAGHETTANMLGNALFLLFRHPEQLARLREQPSLMPKAVEECLRFESSVQITVRVALEPMEIGGVSIAVGESIYLALGAANRDPAVFEEPDRFDIDRPDATPKALSFGNGIHYCIGARLARMELESALETLFHRLPNLRIDNLDGLQWKPTFNLRGLQSLPATW